MGCRVCPPNPENNVGSLDIPVSFEYETNTAGTFNRNPRLFIITWPPIYGSNEWNYYNYK